MKFNTMATKSLIVGTALVLSLGGLVGCGQQNSSTSSAASSSVTSTAQSAQTAPTTNWNSVANGEEAAKGAGFDVFAVPEVITLDSVTFTNPTFSYADGVAQAVYETGATMLTIRKANGNHTAPLTDRNTAEFASNWTKTYSELNVTLYGAAKGAATVLTWNDGTQEFAVTYQGTGGDEISMDSDESAALVNSIKDANANAAANAQNNAENNAQNTQSTSQEQSSSSTSNAQSSSQTSSQSSSQSGGTSSGSGMEVQVSKESATATAVACVGLSGTEKNVKATDAITGGGTIYYIIEFDGESVHYRIMIDAIDGSVLDVMETRDGRVITYDEQGNEVLGEEVE